MRVEIIGAGSLGLLFAAKLSLLLAEEQGESNGGGLSLRIGTHTERQAEELRRTGILFDGMQQQTGVSNLRQSDVYSFEKMGEIDPKEPSEHPDWIWLMVKQTHLDDDLIAYLGNKLKLGSRLLCFQNGIGHVERLSAAVPPERIYVAVTTEAARKNGLAGVTHTGFGTTTIGCADQREVLADKKAQNAVNLLNRAGFKAFLSNDTNSILWNKLLINAVINPLTAILRIRNGQLLDSPYYMELMRVLLEEGRQAAEAAEVRLPSDLWEQLLEVCRKTAGNTSSMLQDVLAERRTEVDSINGSIIKMAREQGLDTPGQEFVYRMIKGMENRQETGDVRA